jgi:hypothetical protein
MRGAKVLRFARRMERVPEADKSADAAGIEELVGDKTGNAAPKRLAADEQLLARWALRPQLIDSPNILAREHFGAWRRAPFPARSPSRHIVELESRYLQSSLDEETCHLVEERARHRRARSMCEQDVRIGVCRTGGQKFCHGSEVASIECG